MTKKANPVKSAETQATGGSLCSIITRTLISLIVVLILLTQLNSLRKQVAVSDVYQAKEKGLDNNFPSRIIKSNGISMNVIVMGREENFNEATPADKKDPLIVYLHGFPQSASTTWHFQLKDFEKKNFKYGGKSFSLMAPDLRGYNATEKPDPDNYMNYDIGELVHDVKGLIDGYYKNSGGKAYVVAHDWGAVIAWALASTYPETLEKLIILNVPHPGVLQREVATLPYSTMFAQLRKSWYIFFMQLGFSIPENYFSNNNYTKISFAFADLARKGILNINDYHEYVKSWSQPNTLKAMMAYYRSVVTGKYLNAIKMKLGYPDARRYPKVGQTLELPTAQQAVKVPTLILWGKDDIALIEESADLSFKYYVDDGVKAKSKLLKLDAGHFVSLEIPEKVNQEIEDFVSSK